MEESKTEYKSMSEASSKPSTVELAPLTPVTRSSQIRVEPENDKLPEIIKVELLNKMPEETHCEPTNVTNFQRLYLTKDNNHAVISGLSSQELLLIDLKTKAPSYYRVEKKQSGTQIYHHNKELVADESKKIVDLIGPEYVNMATQFSIGIETFLITPFSQESNPNKVNFLLIYSSETSNIFPNSRREQNSNLIEHSINIRNLNENKLIQINSAHKERICALAVTQKKRLLISASLDGTIKTWNFGTWEYIRTLEQAVIYEPILSLKVSEDGNFLYSGNTDGSIFVWAETDEAGNGDFKLKHMFTNVSGGEIRALALVSNDRFVIAASKNGTVSICDIQAKTFLYAYTNLYKGDVNSLEVTTDDKFIVGLAKNGTIFIIELGCQQESRFTVEKGIGVKIQDFKALNRDCIVIGDSSGKIEVWNSDPTKRFQLTQKNEKEMLCLEISADNSYIITGSSDGSVDIWDLNNKQLLCSYSHLEEVDCVIFSRDGAKAFSGSRAGSLFILDIRSKGKQEIKEAHNDRILALASSNNNKYLMSGSKDKSIKVWNLETTEPFEIPYAHAASILHIRTSHSQELFYSSSNDRTIKIWEIGNKKALHTIEITSKEPIKNFNVSKDDKFLFVFAFNGIMEVYSLHNKQLTYVSKKRENSIDNAMLTSDNAQIILLQQNSFTAIENPFRDLVVQYEPHCSPYSVLRFMPLKSFINNVTNPEQLLALIRSYPDFQIPSLDWNWFHLTAILCPSDLIITVCIKEQIPFAVDSFKKTPLHYLLENRLEGTSAANLVLQNFGVIMDRVKRPFELLNALSDIFIQILKIDSPQMKPFLLLCPQKPSKDGDIYGDIKKKGKRDFCLLESSFDFKKAQETLINTKKKKKISLKMLPFSWDFSCTSDHIQSLVKVLQDSSNQEIFQTDTLSIIINYLWGSIKYYQYFLFCLSFVQTALVIGLIIFEVEKTTLKGCLLGCAGLSAVYELLEARGKGFLKYLSSFWNWFDVILITIFVTIPLLDFEDIEKDAETSEDEEFLDQAESLVSATLITLMVVRLLSHLRCVKGTRIVIRMIVQIIKDHRGFILVFIFLIFEGALCLQLFGKNEDFKISLMNVYLTLFGNSILEGDSTMKNAFLIAFTVFVYFIFLNMLIASMGETYSKMQELSKIVNRKEVLDLAAESISVLRSVRRLACCKRKPRGQSGNENKKYLYYVEVQTRLEHSTNQY